MRELSRSDIRLGRPQSPRACAAWAAASRLITQSLALLTFVVLARLLPPSDFGLAAIASVVTGFGLILTDLGLGISIIHIRLLETNLASAAFWVNALSGVVLAIIVLAIRGPLSHVFGQPRLSHLFLIASLTFLFSLSATHLAILERELYFRLIAFIEITAALAGAVVAVLAARAGAGATSLVIAPVINVSVISILAGACVRFRPGLTGRASFHKVFATSSGVAGFNIINYWARNADNLLLGLTTTVTDLAYYSRAYQLMLAPVQQVTIVMGRVLLPTLAKNRDDPLRQRRSYLTALRVSAAVLFPLSLTLAASASAFVSVLLGRHWAGMVPILAVLALSTPPQIVAGPTGAVYQAHNKGAVLFRKGGIFSMLTVLAICAGLPWGGIGVATAFCVRSYLLLPYIMSYPLKLSGVSVRDAINALLGVTVASGSSSGLAYLQAVVVPLASPAAELATQVVGAALIYFLALRLFAPAAFGELTDLVRRRARLHAVP